MPRDNDKNNDSRGRRDRPGDGKSRAGEGKGRAGGGKGRSGTARGPEKKFAKRGFGGKDFADKSGGERRPYAGKSDSSDGAKAYGKKPYSGPGKPYAGKREGASPRFNRDEAPRGEKRPYTPREDRGDARPAARFSDRKFGDKKPYASRDGGGE
jgi:23S rRNA pseudouridine2605 synthase